MNIKLASCLVGYEIDVYCNQVEEIEIDDVDLEEFIDEIDGWVIEFLKVIGCDMAWFVLEFSKDELLCCIDLEEEIVVEVLGIFVVEFED